MSGTNSDFIVVRQSISTSMPRVKSPPKSNVIRIPFEYNASDDGVDENLLILLHGLGDTHLPFTKMGKSLKLPQTAILALRAPDQIPYLYEPAYQWYTSFDPLGDIIERPNPTPALDLLDTVFKHLAEDCQWPPDRIHLFGFSQGGSVAAEFALKWWRSELEKHKQARIQPSDPEEQGNDTPYSPKALASVVTVAGPLLSYPTMQMRCPTPLLIIYRPQPSQTSLSSGALAAFKKGFSNTSEVNLSAGEGMPRSRDEWEPIMRFWSERLSRRQVEGLYEIMTGAPSR